ncbi:1927_t:CDS:1, partial [Scutellospora calospora]
MVAQLTNAEASTSYAAIFKTDTFYVVNAEVSTPYMIIIDQVANIENSTSYTFNAEVNTSDVVNTEISTSYVINIQTNTSYTINAETNALCENAGYDKATTEK